MRKTLNKVQTGKSLLEDLATLARETNDVSNRFNLHK